MTSLLFLNGCKHTFQITHVRISHNSKGVLMFSLKYLLHYEICARELCEKCVYNHSSIYCFYINTKILKNKLLFLQITYKRNIMEILLPNLKRSCLHIAHYLKFDIETYFCVYCDFTRQPVKISQI